MHKNCLEKLLFALNITFVLTLTVCIFIFKAILASEKKRPKLFIDVYIDEIPGDKFSESFYSKPGNDLFTSVITWVSEYYTTCGWNHILGTIDVYTKLLIGSLDPN